MPFKSQPRIPAELRESFDSRDPFITGGHQILKPRGNLHYVPEWIWNNNAVAEVLLRSFPHLNDRRSKKYVQHRLKARLWMHIINLYFRNGMTLTQVVDEPASDNWKLTPKKVAGLAWDIKRAGDRYLEGIRPKPRGGKRPGAGRPKTQIKAFCRRISRLPRQIIKKRCLKPLVKRVNSRSSEK
jgi:hypothetical protein